MASRFFTTLRQTLTPRGYTTLRGATLKETIRFMIMLLLFGLVLKAVFSLPSAIMSIQELQSSPDHFSKASFRGAIQTSEPFNLPPSDPILQIDTSDGAQLEGMILLTDEQVRYRIGEETRSIPFPDLSKQPDSSTITMLALAGILILGPSLAFYALVLPSIKVALTALLLAGLAFLIGRITRKDTRTFSQALSLALFSTSWIILLESILIPLQRSEVLFPIYHLPGLSLYLVPLTLTAIIFLIVYIGFGSERYELAETQTY